MRISSTNNLLPVKRHISQVVKLIKLQIYRWPKLFNASYCFPYHFVGLADSFHINITCVLDKTEKFTDVR